MKSKIKTFSKLSEIKELEQKDLQHQIKGIKKELDEEQRKLELFETMFSEAFIEFGKRNKEGSIYIHELELFYNYFSHMNRNIDAQKNLIAEKLNELGNKENVLIKTYQEKKVYETLKGRLLKCKEKNDNTLIQKEIDFLIISRRSKEDE
jgi:flagellar export protein FliJ